ncbi:tetratricopeptide repeat protein [Singulisphaera sp. Ch08]|uniref:Tetratricopeptide repeat protein n=1 Tax=Singulisphaera sp. Ch08 TaxID=3120278 RepID=A0AAU7C7C3_9BACT
MIPNRANALLPALLILAAFGPVAGLWAPAVRAADEVARSLQKEPIFEGLGSHGRKITTNSPEAQRYFNQGLAFLYAFNHDEAIRSFRQATELDPACAMAWWGIAMAHGPHINNPVVPEERARAAWNAIVKARSHQNKASVADQALIEATAKRYSETPPEDRKALDQAYATAMGQVWRDHPKDADIGSLYAESLMDLRPWDLWQPNGAPFPGTETVVKTLEETFAIDPNHPLACHLYIHAVEASPHPEKALPAADRLRFLQPGLPHMVHMPSHIDVRLGRWKSAVETNERAVAADRAYRTIRPTQGFYRIYMLHDYHLLAFAALMRGESRKAIRTIDAMLAEIPMEWARENAAIVDGVFAMPLEVRLRFGRWDEVLAAPEPEATFPIARAFRHAARGVSFAATGRIELARGAQKEFRAARTRVPENARFGNNSAPAILDVAEHLLAGELLYREGHEEAAFDALTTAVRAEDALNYDEPPDWILPVRHALGAALMTSGHFERAEAVYREDLKRLPDNGWSLYGLMRALEAQNKDEEAKLVRTRWDAVWKDADVQISSSCFCLSGQ